MVPFWTTSAAENGGAISPPAKTWIWNLLSVASATILARTSAPPCSVSSDFGKLVVRRHLISGIDCAMAGAAIVVAAAPMPAVCNMLRRLSLVMTAILLLNPVGRRQGAPILLHCDRRTLGWSGAKKSGVSRPSDRIAQIGLGCLDAQP